MGVPYPRFANVSIDPGAARAAALTLCDRATSVEDARMLLEACGLISYQHTGHEQQEATS
jgi:hypothetical protein